MTDHAIAPSEDLTLHLPVVDDQGNPVDVTGATGEFPAYDAPLSRTVLLSGSMAVTDGPGGLVAFTLPGTATAPFAGEFHVLYYELWVIHGGARTRADHGKLTLV
jgi:hypothetical protein